MAVRCGFVVSKWISVEDRLPDFNVKVLAYWRPIDHVDRPFHREIIVAERTVHLPDGGASIKSDQWWGGSRSYDQATFITHWQPLPEPPGDSPE